MSEIDSKLRRELIRRGTDRVGAAAGGLLGAVARQTFGGRFSQVPRLGERDDASHHDPGATNGGILEYTTIHNCRGGK